MKIATYRWGGRRYVRQLSPDGTELAPLALVIATGTPAGVGMAMSPPVWLKSGGRMRIEIDGIGVLENALD